MNFTHRIEGISKMFQNMVCFDAIKGVGLKGVWTGIQIMHYIRLQPRFTIQVDEALFTEGTTTQIEP